MENLKKNKYYNFEYEPFPRWCSYWYQIHETLSLAPKNVIEIGIGNSVVSKYIKDKGVSVTTLDIDKSLEPDIVASVDDIPLKDNSYEVVLAAEILEHLCFENFSKSMHEIHRITKRYAIISLPHHGSSIVGVFKIPLIRWLRFSFKLPNFLSKENKNEDHRWEIGRKGYSISRVKRIMSETGFSIVRDYIIPEYPYHHFFVLKKITN